MGFLGEVSAFERATVDGAQTPEVRLDRGGDEPATVGHYTPPGIDAAPLPGDNAYAGDDVGAGAAQAVGYQDPTTPPVAAGGEVRLYSRSGPGVASAEVWCKADGTLVLRNPLGSVELGPDGSMRAGNAVGELAVDAAGVVTWKTALGLNGAATHTHPTPFGPSGPPIPGT